MAEADAKPNGKLVLVVGLFGLSIVAFAFAAFYVYIISHLQTPSIDIQKIEVMPGGGLFAIIAIINLSVAVFSLYFPLLIAVWVGFSFATRANALMRAAFYEQTSVVPQRDFELVSEAIKRGEPGAITEYIRLASLTGSVGIFQKIGLTGLPLVTLALVLFFAVGVMLFDDKSDTFKAFLDFTKLTLGAFIGSFVQRQVENRSRETELQRAIATVTRGATGQGSDPKNRPGGSGDETAARPGVDVTGVETDRASASVIPQTS